MSHVAFSNDLKFHFCHTNNDNNYAINFLSYWEYYRLVESVGSIIY